MIQGLIAFAAENDITKSIDSIIPGGLANIFNFGLALGALIAFGTIIYAGILYSASGDNSSKQKDAREWIWAAIQGLGLLALGFIILRIINPNLVSIKPVLVNAVPDLVYDDNTPLGNYTPLSFSTLGTSGFVSPLSVVTIGNSVYGNRCSPMEDCCRPHKGIDLTPSCGTPIMAMSNGTLWERYDEGGFGNYAVVDRGDGYASYYGHMSGFNTSLTDGQQVTAGQVIGYVGTTGASTGCHLHLEIRYNGVDTNVNPLFGASDKQANMEAECLPTGSCGQKSCS